MTRPGSGDHLLVTTPVGPSPEQITASKGGGHSEQAAREHCDRRLREQRQQGWQCGEQVRDIPVAEDLRAKLERLLDENLVSATARRELDALRYGIAMARRH